MTADPRKRRAINLYYQKAVHHMGLGQWEQAMAAYRRILGLDGMMLDVRLRLAELCLRQGRCQDAMDQCRWVLRAEHTGPLQRKALKLLVEMNPGDLESRLALAVQYREQGLDEEAGVELAFVAALLEQRGEMGRWVQVTEQLLELRPNDVPRARLLAQVLLAQGEASRAARWMHWALIAAPHDVECVILLADALVQLEDTDSAIERLVEVAATDGLDRELEGAIHTRLELLTTVVQVPVEVDDQLDDLEVPESGPVPWDPTAFACVVPLHPSIATLAPETALGPVPAAELENPDTLYGKEIVVNGLAPFDDAQIDDWANVMGDVLGFPDESPILDQRVFDSYDVAAVADVADGKQAQADMEAGGRPRRTTLAGVCGPTLEQTKEAEREETSIMIEDELERARALIRDDQLEKAGAVLRALARQAPGRRAVRHLMSEVRCRLLSRSLGDSAEGHRVPLAS